MAKPIYQPIEFMAKPIYQPIEFMAKPIYQTIEFMAKLIWIYQEPIYWLNVTTVLKTVIRKFDYRKTGYLKEIKKCVTLSKEIQYYLKTCYLKGIGRSSKRWLVCYPQIIVS